MALSSLIASSGAIFELQPMIRTLGFRIAINQTELKMNRVRVARWLAASIVAALPVINMATAQRVPISSGSVTQAVAGLRPGQYVWAPQLAPAGPVLVVVNLATQRAVVFRNGLPIAASTISTGRPGYETPTGVFTILQKHVEHYSSTYDNAPMPFMQRLTWRGVALHAGKLPGFPASHGCIRLPFEFAQLLYKLTKVGMTVIITNRAAMPRIAPSPMIAASDPAVTEASIEWHPETSPQGPVSIIVSVADQRAFVLRNGLLIGSAPVKVDGPVTGTWAYALRSMNSTAQRWIRLNLNSGTDADATVAQEEWARFHAPEEFKKAVAGTLAPGATVIVTPDSLRAGSTGTALTVIEADAPAKP